MSASTVLDALTASEPGAVPSQPPSEATSQLVGEIVIAGVSIGAALVGQEWIVPIAESAIQGVGDKLVTAEEAIAKLLGMATKIVGPDKLRQLLDTATIASANAAADAVEDAKFGPAPAGK